MRIKQDDKCKTLITGPLNKVVTPKTSLVSENKRKHGIIMELHRVLDSGIILLHWYLAV